MINATHPDKDAPVAISIRPVVIPGDIRLLQQWIGIEGDSLIHFYESVQHASFIQSLMVCYHDAPVFQLDVCESLFDDLGTGDALEPGDYTIRLQLAPDATPIALVQGLYNSLAYVFREKHAARILLPVYATNTLLQNWATEAGFKFIKPIALKPKQLLYLLSGPNPFR